MAKTRFLFASDFHGSEMVWRKFLNSAKYFKVDALVESGDMTGKMVIPVVETPSGNYEATLLGKHYDIKKEKLPEFEKKVRFMSYYPYPCDRGEFEKMQTDKKYTDKIFEDLMVKTMEYWLSLVPDRVPDHVRVVITPGNDDSFAIDPVIKKNPRVIFGEGEVLDLDGEHEVPTCGWTTPTPWDTPRECSEEELLEKLEAVIGKIQRIDTSVFCFHCPPYGTPLDECPMLDENLRVVTVRGDPVIIHVGSKAVRQVIEKYQPLASLHGHIHESSGFTKIGRTFVINPGSEYAEGILRAFLVEIDGKKVKRLQRIEA